jgi:L-threonylcarbamoyladenylate synthase
MITTQIIKLDPENPSHEAIESAANIIRAGGLVAFPTETVYGLGADAASEAAVRRVFQAKGRPPDNPLIVHIATREMLARITTSVPEKASRLIESFWPGPLTLVLSRSPSIPGIVSAGLSTIAVRMPRGRIALELIRASETAIAAPSANLSGRPSPTRAEHVQADLSANIEMILDGGDTDVGIESTVIDMTADPPVILRPGWITGDQIRRTIGDIGDIGTSGSEEALRRSPGTRHKHYAPQARVILVETSGSASVGKVCAEQLAKGPVAFIGHTRLSMRDPLLTQFNVANSARAYAASLYSALRSLDQTNPKTIVIEGISDDAEGAAVMDRLRRAASEIVA